MKIGILGYGEIGKAIAKLYDKPMIKDLDQNTFKGGMDIMHICIPYNERFKTEVYHNVEEYDPRIVVIHSTVKPGTTKELNEMQGNRFLYSPVIGVHPRLYRSLKIFPKWIGFDNNSILAVEVTRHFEGKGLKTLLASKSITLETAKLLSTTYYALCISYADYADKICKEFDIPYDVAMKEWNINYNEGYKEMEMEHVIRPILTPPKDSKIGGHCLIPNAELLKEVVGDDPILQAILRHK